MTNEDLRYYQKNNAAWKLLAANTAPLISWVLSALDRQILP
jgi:hypothetical protein